LCCAAAAYNASSISILAGTGSGTFGAPVNLATGTNPRDVAVVDFNGDGRLDLATANEGSHTISILLGTGPGTFQAPSTTAPAATARTTSPPPISTLTAGPTWPRPTTPATAWAS